MRSDVKSELQMLRELVWWGLGLPQEKAQTISQHENNVRYCFFCWNPLLVSHQPLTFGHRRHPKINVDITIHHKDENRENNDPSNLVLCHDHCHRSYHAQKRAAFRKEVIRRYESEERKEGQEETEEVLRRQP